MHAAPVTLNRSEFAPESKKKKTVSASDISALAFSVIREFVLSAVRLIKELVVPFSPNLSNTS